MMLELVDINLTEEVCMGAHTLILISHHEQPDNFKCTINQNIINVTVELLVTTAEEIFIILE